MKNKTVNEIIADCGFSEETRFVASDPRGEEYGTIQIQRDSTSFSKSTLIHTGECYEITFNDTESLLNFISAHCYLRPNA
jgi:hypothetical protein